MAKLGVNVDHIATLRQARRSQAPDPVIAACICEAAGCDSIVAHLREDRRHINDSDVKRLKRTVRTRFNLEMSIAPDIVKIASLLRPHQATLVPERREELTTEGGLDTVANRLKLKRVIKRLTDCGIEVSIFIDPDREQIDASYDAGVKIIELHTGRYADAKSEASRKKELDKIIEAANFADGLGLIVNAGHGLDYGNVQPISAIKCVNELNIGYSIICHSVFIGLKEAVREMVGLVK